MPFGLMRRVDSIPIAIDDRRIIPPAKPSTWPRDLVERLRSGVILMLIVIFSFAREAIAQPSDAGQAAVHEALIKWTADFNAGNRQGICSLFSPDLLYDYKGQPERNYRDICDLLQRSLSDPTRRYTYSLAVHEILVSGDLAVVRLTWTLRITRNDMSGETASREQGMDVFRKQPDGSWKIIRYIAYEVDDGLPGQAR
jgi:ketosteroid isomerase-like protein